MNDRAEPFQSYNKDFVRKVADTEGNARSSKSSVQAVEGELTVSELVTAGLKLTKAIQQHILDVYRR